MGKFIALTGSIYQFFYQAMFFLDKMELWSPSKMKPIIIVGGHDGRWVERLKNIPRASPDFYQLRMPPTQTRHHFCSEKIPQNYHTCCIKFDPPPTPKVMEKNGVPLSTYLPTQTHMHHFFSISNMIPGIPPPMAPYPQAIGHCLTSRFHVDVSWHKSQASAVLGRPVFFRIRWLDLRNPQKMLKNAAVTKTEWGSTPIHWWHVAK